MNYKEIDWKGVEWNDLVQDAQLWLAFVNTVMNLGFRKLQGI